MKKSRKILSLVAFLIIGLSVFSQKREIPAPIEFFGGNNRAYFQLNLVKPIVQKWSYSNITIATAPYETDIKAVMKGKRVGTELIMVNNFRYNFKPYFSAGVGMQYHFLKGFVPNISVATRYVDRVWLLAISPYFNILPTRNLETIVVAEFKPFLTSKVQLYSKIQALYNRNLEDNTHDRSFVNFRLGVKWQKVVLGAGANLDYYGKDRKSKDNYGGFVMVYL